LMSPAPSSRCWSLSAKPTYLSSIR
jgi:hypothetical protein